MADPVIIYEPILYKGVARIRLIFPYNESLNQVARKITGSQWSRTLRSWHIPDTPENRKMCGLHLPAFTPDTVAPLKQAPTKPGSTGGRSISMENQQQFNRFVQLLELKSYSTSTIRTYSKEFRIFLETIGKHDAKQLSAQRIKDYLQYCHNTLKLSENTIHSRINALKFYYEQY